MATSFAPSKCERTGFQSPAWRRRRRLCTMTAELFAQAVIAAGEGDAWTTCSAGRGGCGFFLIADRSRRGRVLFQMHAEDGPTLVLGETEIALTELADAQLHSWVTHLNARRGASADDIELLRRVWRILGL